MNILVEINPLEGKQKTGISTYIDFLCRALLEQRSPDERFTFYAPDILDDPFPEYPNKTFQGHRLLSRVTLETVWQHSAFRGIPADMDIYHLPFPSLPAPRKGRNTCFFATIYDMAFAYYPESVIENFYFRYLANAITTQAEQADVILVISESCKRDLHDILGTPNEKMHVIYPGIDLKRPTEADFARCESVEWQEMRVPPNYILCVGTWEPRKNLPNLFRALHKLRKLLIEKDVYLCMSGIKGWKYQDAERLISDLGLEERVRTLGHVRRDFLPLLYARARCFVYPSIYEGFGMPVTEAMACGAPVVTSNVSSMPEAAGDAALLVNPHDVDELAAAIERLLTDDTLRHTLIEKGYAHAAQFTWAQSARAHLALYREFAGQPAR